MNRVSSTAGGASCAYCLGGAIVRRVQSRRNSFRTSLNQSTPLAIATHTHHWPAESGTVPKAMLRKDRCRTAHRGVFASRQHLHSGKALRKANTSARSEPLICQCVMSAFTSSESTSVTKTSGGKVIGGPINGKGSLTIEVKGTGTIIV